MTSGSPFKYNNDDNAANNGMEGPYDNATVAVMESLNLHDALVRIPMNHGDLGPNSHVGHADHLAARRMTKVSLNDFFAVSRLEREGQFDWRSVRSSLWMNDLPIMSATKASGETKNNDSERECKVDQSPNERREKLGAEEVGRNNTPIQQPRGMSPFDPKFLAMTAGFLACINFSSRLW